MKKKLKIVFSMLALPSLLALTACEKKESPTAKLIFFTCKIDGVMFGEEGLIEEPYAKYDKKDDPQVLVITAKDPEISLKIYLYDKPDFTGTYHFGDYNPDGTLKHYARISYGPNGEPADYAKDSWFANGGTDAMGSITITGYDTVHHKVEGIFEGSFYNNDKESAKIVSEGKFSLPLGKHSR